VIFLTSIFLLSQSLHFILAFDGTNYEYWKARVCFFLKSIVVWQIGETGWIKPDATTAELSVAQNSARLSNDKALHFLCQAFFPLSSQQFQIVNPLKKRGKS
jgi:hypothetical protein